MYKLKELTDDDVVRHEDAIRCAYGVYGDIVGVFYLVEDNGEEAILHNCDNVFMLIHDNDNQLRYTMFAIDDNFELSDLGYPKFEYHIMDGEKVFLDRESGKSFSIALSERQDGDDVDGYNGYVRFTQFDPNTKERATITFQHMINSNGIISPFHIKKPFQVLFQSNVKITKNGEFKCKGKKSYIAKTYDIYDDKTGYDIATIKDFGLQSFLEQGSYSLQKNEKRITKYYKILCVTNNLYAITGFPFTRQYNLEDMIAMLEERGFSYEIPQEYLDVYNGNDELLSNITMLIEEIKKHIAYEDEPYVLEMSDKNAN